MVKYYRNGALLYTSHTLPLYPLLVDTTALFSLNLAVLKEIRW